MLGAFGYVEFSLDAGESYNLYQTYNVIFVAEGEANIAMLTVSSYRGLEVLNGNYNQNDVSITNEVGFIKITNNTEYRMNHIRVFTIKHI